MTQKQEHLRKQLLIKIHTNKEYKFYKDNEAWEDFLILRFKVSSSKFLSLNELKILLDILEAKIKDDIDFKPDYKGRALLHKGSQSQKQRIYLKALLEQSKMGIFAFYKLCKKTLKKDIDSLSDLNKEDCSIMLIVLEKICRDKS